MNPMKRPWTSKKEPTNPKKKEAHEDRKVKKVRLRELREEDWEQQVREYNASSTVQE
jgi:hypothetical protein